jgi:hypothetical protein
LKSQMIAMSFLFKRKLVSTTLKIAPSIFQIESGRSITLKAQLNPPKAPVDRIEWSLEGLGELSATKGPATTYKAPTVNSEAKVRVTASLPTSSGYLSSSAYAEGLVLPAGKAAKIATALAISPQSFSISSGESLNLNAVLTDFQGKTLGYKKIKWSMEPQVGELNPSNSGASYTAPTVEAETQVTVTAVFEGDEQHLESRAVCLGLVAPSTPSEEYIMSFSKAEASNLRVDGGFEVSGVKTVKVTVENLELSDLKISRVNLSSQSGDLRGVEIYATRFKAHIPESDRSIDVKGGDDVHLEASEASFDNGLIYFVKMSCAGGELRQPEVVARYVGGEEPYLPILLTTSNISMEKGFSVTGPETYGVLENKATKILCGRISASNFTLKCPKRYRLDREDNIHEFAEKWTMNATSAAIEQAEIYSIYFKVRALLVWRVKATGEEYIPSIIPEGLHRGEKAPINDAEVDIVSLKADKISVLNVTLTLK